MRKPFIILLIALGWGTAAWAQDPVFSQFYAAPLQVNPAFTGITFAPRVTLNYRNQWPAWPNAYVTYAATYEQPLEALNSGLGIQVMADVAGDGIYRTNRAAGTYGYQVRLNDDFYVKFGVEAGMIQTRVDWDALLFLDQLDPLTGAADGEGNPNLSQEQRPERLNRTVFDVGAGLLAYSGRFYAGVAVKHLNRPDDRLLEVNENLGVGLPLRLTVHGGAEFELERGNNRKLPSFISPNVMYNRQGDLQQLNLGAYAGLDKFFGGLWYRHTFEGPDAVIGMAGVRYGVLRIGYSYDYTISRLSNGNTGGTHEISLMINFEESAQLQAKRRQSRYNNCFKMFN